VSQGEKFASSGHPVAQLALVVLELDFCLPERTGTRARLNDTAEMDERERCSWPPATAAAARLVFAHIGHEVEPAVGCRWSR
jgi:hypothetical protein